MTGDGHAKRASFGSIVRKRLSDITNSQPPPPPDRKLSLTENCSVKEHIENLVKENLALANIIAEKNKIIEFAGNEMHTLRVNFQKMQVQNRTLAMTNSQMLAELNLGRNMLRTLNHEISCKNGMIIAMNLELKEKVKANKIQKSCCSQPVDEETIIVNKCEEKDQKIKTRIVGRPTGRSQSMGSLLAKEIMEIPVNKRLCLRRQSSVARFKSREQEEEEEGLEAQVGVVNNSPMVVSNKRKNGGGESDRRRRESSSMGRPSRKATEKVHSYKEVPINVKMRRL